MISNEFWEEIKPGSFFRERNRSKQERNKGETSFLTAGGGGDLDGVGFGAVKEEMGGYLEGLMNRSKTPNKGSGGASLYIGYATSKVDPFPNVSL